MKKKFNAALAIVCVCLMAMAQPVLASGTPHLSASADAAKADKGQTVKVKISLTGNPKISTLGMSLSYDAGAFEYKDCSWSGSIGGNDMKMASGSGGNVSLSLVCDKSYTADGAVATVSFQAKKDGAVVDMDLGLREMADEDLEDVTNCKVSAAVRVPEAAGKSETQTTASKKPATTKRVSQKPAATTKTSSTSSRTSGNKTAGKTDDSYKTGVLAGEDVLFVIAAVCGLAAFIFWNERKKGTLG